MRRADDHPIREPDVGSKTKPPQIWAALGVDVGNYVEPFYGMAGCNYDEEHGA